MTQQESRRKLQIVAAENTTAAEVPATFQKRVAPWLMACFGAEIAADRTERNHRFLEESLELVQACGCTQSEAHQLVDYVFNRPIGVVPQEIGGVMVTLAALCLAQDEDMHRCGDVELERIWTMVEKIRAKQAAKPKHSPLPALPASQPFAYFQWNEGWNHWEEVVPSAAGREGVVAAYRDPKWTVLLPEQQ